MTKQPYLNTGAKPVCIGNVVIQPGNSRDVDSVALKNHLSSVGGGSKASGEPPPKAPDAVDSRTPPPTAAEKLKAAAKPKK